MATTNALPYWCEDHRAVREGSMTYLISTNRNNRSLQHRAEDMPLTKHVAQQTEDKCQLRRMKVAS
eukprot:6144399-Amphidinium_carterae.1